MEIYTGCIENVFLLLASMKDCLDSSRPVTQKNSTVIGTTSNIEIATGTYVIYCRTVHVHFKFTKSYSERNLLLFSLDAVSSSSISAHSTNEGWLQFCYFT